MPMICRSIDVDAVHRDPGDAFDQYVMIPARMSCVSAENQLYATIQLLQCFCPLHRLGGVDFFGDLLDLPVSPDFIAKAPIFDLWSRDELYYQTVEMGQTNVIRLFSAMLTSQIGVVCISRAVAIFNPGESFI